MLSTKKLLYKLTQRVRNSERFAPASASSKFGSTYNSVGEYFPATDTVIFNFSWRASSNVTGSDVLFTVPTAYRPLTGKNGSGMLITDANVPIAVAFTINASGEIRHDGSSSFARQGYGMIMYHLNS